MRDPAHAIVLSLVSSVAPHELSVLDDVLEALESAGNRREDPLASGVGDSWVWAHMASPTLLAVASWMAKDILAKAASELIVPRLKTLAERLLLKKPAAPAQGRALDSEDLRAIAAVLDVLEENARLRGLTQEAIILLSQAVVEELKATLAAAPSS